MEYKNVQSIVVCYPYPWRILSMDTKLITQLKILKLTNSKPNFSELARIYDVDRRTVKKYYDGYEGKPKHRKKQVFLPV